MKSIHTLAEARMPRPARTTVCCDLVGYAGLRVSPQMIPALRQKPGPVPGPPFPASFLKHADEQTMAGLTAVFQAIHDHGLGQTQFTDWGILAAPRFLGRASMAVALHRFQQEGAWGISPHLIPHHSLHSLSGTVSQALKVHGPNFGVGGGPHAADEGILTAATLLAGDRVPGVWLIFTGHDPELIPAIPGDAVLDKPHASEITIGAIALALVIARPGTHFLKMHISSGPDPQTVDAGQGDLPDKPFFSLENLLHALLEDPPLGGWQLHCGGEVELNRYGAGAEN